VTLPAAGGIVPMSRLELAEAGAWRRGQLVYHDRPLGKVLSDLERYRGGRILALDADLAARRVTGTFPLAAPDAALDAIATTLGIAVTRLPLLALVRPA
jgi:transmembrane sensor